MTSHVRTTQASPRKTTTRLNPAERLVQQAIGLQLESGAMVETSRPGCGSITVCVSRSSTYLGRLFCSCAAPSENKHGTFLCLDRQESEKTQKRLFLIAVSHALSQGILANLPLWHPFTFLLCQTPNAGCSQWASRQRSHRREILKCSCVSQSLKPQTLRSKC